LSTAGVVVPGYIRDAFSNTTDAIFFTFLIRAGTCPTVRGLRCKPVGLRGKG
jgi:hypothetical protein